MSDYTLTSPIDVSSSGVNSQINLYDSTGTYAVNINTPTLSSNVDFTLPSTSGVSGQLLQRTGPTSLGWANATGVVIPGNSLPTSIFFNYANMPTQSISLNPDGTGTTIFVAYFYYCGSMVNPVSRFTIVYSLSGIPGSDILVSLINASGNPVMTNNANVYGGLITNTTTGIINPTQPGSSLLRVGVNYNFSPFGVVINLYSVYIS